MQEADGNNDRQLQARIGSALRGPLHKALGLALPRQILHSTAVHTTACQFTSEPISIDWVDKVGLSSGKKLTKCEPCTHSILCSTDNQSLTRQLSATATVRVAG